MTGRDVPSTYGERYNWHSAGSLRWPFPTPKYKYTFQIERTEQFYQTALGNCYGLNITEMLIAALRNEFIVC